MKNPLSISFRSISFLYTKRERKTKMAISKGPAVWVLVYVLASPQFSSAAPSQCDLTVLHGNDLYTFSLAHPTYKYPHGILSEDGYFLFSPLPLSWYSVLPCSFMYCCLFAPGKLMGASLVFFFSLRFPCHAVVVL